MRLRLQRALIVICALMLLASCLRTSPDCNAGEARAKLGSLFSHQLKLTPYIRFIDMQQSRTNIERVFTISSSDASASCVAFVTYAAQLNEAGRKADADHTLLYNFLYELRGEKQVYYTVRIEPDGRANVRVDRVGG